MHTLTASDGVELAYRTFGTGSTDVVLVHGWVVSGAAYDDLIDALGTDGVRLIVPDLRGTGRSGSADGTYTTEQYGKDIMAVADAAGAKSFVIVGHSMGGQLAQWIAPTWPDRVLGAALLCPVPASGMTLPADAHGLFRNSAQNREMQTTILGLACKQLAEGPRERLLDDAGKISAACIQGAFDSWTGADFAAKLGEIRASVLVVGTDDPFFPQAFLRDAVVSKIKRASLVYHPGPGHYPGSESPRETAAILRAFFTPLLQG